MQNNNQRKAKHYPIPFFLGIGLSLISVILIIDVGYIARFFAFPFLYLFGLGSFILYLLLYVIGFSFLFREKGIKVKHITTYLGSIVIFVGLLMVFSLLSIAINNLRGSISFSNFVDYFHRDIIGSIYPNYWDSKFINIFANVSNGGTPLGGGIIGYFLVTLLENGLQEVGTWVFSVLIVLSGFVLSFYPLIKKAYNNRLKKAPKKAEEPIENSFDFSTNENRPVTIQQTAPIQPSQPQRPDFNRVNEMRPNRNYSQATSIFRPARFVRKTNIPYEETNQTYERPKFPSREITSTPEDVLMEENNRQNIAEQMTLNFDEPQVEMTPVVEQENININIVSNPAPVVNNPTPQPSKPIKWVPPSTDLLKVSESTEASEKNNAVAIERMEMINSVFSDFRVGAKCIDYKVGPSVTRFNIQYESNVSVRSVNNLVEDLSIRLGGVDARFESVVEGQRYSGLEISNAVTTSVSFKEVYENLPDVKKHPLAVAFGKNIEGKVICADFNDFPHVLVAGTTGSGKSIYIHSVIVTLIMRNSPESLRLLLIDPKKVEMAKYRDIPHLLCPIITDAHKAKVAMSKLADEMNNRYEIFENSEGCTSIEQYNEYAVANGLKKMPFIIAIIDEYADLVDTCKEISQPVVSIAQKARAAGIHMLISTQRPSTNVITGVIKGNLPTRVALSVANQVDSVTILGEGGAEKLLGRGDMLVQSPLVSRVGMVRLQGCFIDRQEIQHVIGYLKAHYPVNYDENFLNLEESSAQDGAILVNTPEFQMAADDGEEAKYQSVKEWVMANEYMSMSRIQRECSVGFNRAGRFFKRLQDEGVIAEETEGNKGCPVLTHDKFYDNDSNNIVTSEEITH